MLLQNLRGISRGKRLTSTSCWSIHTHSHAIPSTLGFTRKRFLLGHRQSFVVFHLKLVFLMTYPWNWLFTLSKHFSSSMGYTILLQRAQDLFIFNGFFFCLHFILLKLNNFSTFLAALVFLIFTRFIVILYEFVFQSGVFVNF